MAGHLDFAAGSLAASISDLMQRRPDHFDKDRQRENRIIGELNSPEWMRAFWFAGEGGVEHARVRELTAGFSVDTRPFSRQGVDFEEVWMRREGERCLMCGSLKDGRIFVLRADEKGGEALIASTFDEAVRYTLHAAREMFG